MIGTGGLLITAGLLALLVLRVALAAAWVGQPRARWRLRLLDAALVPLLVAFAAVIVLRFDRLSV